MELSYLKDNIIKKALGNENKDVRNYVARVISHTTGIPFNELKNKLTLVYPEVSSNTNIVNSLADLALKNENRYFSVEVNYSKSAVYKTKNISYIYQLTLRQLTSSEKYSKIKPVTLINIDAFDIIGYGDFIYESEIMVKKYNIAYTDILKIYDINLSYFKKMDYNKIIEEEEGLLKDLAILVSKDEEFLTKLCKGDNELIMTKKVLKDLTKQFDEMFYCSPEELDRQARELLKEELIPEIKEELRTEVKEELKNETKLEDAKNFLQLGIDVNIISKATGLSKEEILSIKE